MTFRNVILIPLSCFWLVSECYATKLSSDDSIRKKSLNQTFSLDFFFWVWSKNKTYHVKILIAIFFLNIYNLSSQKPKQNCDPVGPATSAGFVFNAPISLSDPCLWVSPSPLVELSLLPRPLLQLPCRSHWWVAHRSTLASGISCTEAKKAKLSCPWI